MSTTEISPSDLTAAAFSLRDLLRATDPGTRRRRRGIGGRQEAVPDWRESAACVAEDLDLFFPVSVVGAAAARQVDQAKAVCGRCPVQRTCLDWALRVGPEFGIFGGATAEERRRLREQRGGLRVGEARPLAYRSEEEVLEALEPH